MVSAFQRTPFFKKLDSSLASSIFDMVASMEVIAEQCLYKPNTSLYECGDKIRYVENYTTDGLVYFFEINPGGTFFGLSKTFNFGVENLIADYLEG